MSDEHFSVDGTMIEAWAGHKSFVRVTDRHIEPPMIGILEPAGTGSDERLRGQGWLFFEVPARAVLARFGPCRGAVRGPIEGQAIGVVPQAVDGGRGEEPIAGGGLVPLGEVEIAGDDGGGLLVAFGDQGVQILVGGRAQRFEP